MATTHTHSRRQLLRTIGLASLGVALSACAQIPFLPGGAAPTPETATTPDAALALLTAGNQRFAAGNPRYPGHGHDRRAETAQGQNPWTVVFGCIDSRVPPELVFDRGLGDMFVVRTAGHAIDHAVLGSIEFGVEEFHVPLVVVLGHEACGAVSATIDILDLGIQPPGDVAAIVDTIKPAVEIVRGQSGDLLENAVRANVTQTVQALGNSSILSQALAKGTLKIVGARYDTDAGTVEFLT